MKKYLQDRVKYHRDQLVVARDMEAVSKHQAAVMCGEDLLDFPKRIIRALNMRDS